MLRTRWVIPVLLAVAMSAPPMSEAQATSTVSLSWTNPADDGNGALDSVIVRKGVVVASVFQPQPPSTAFLAAGFGANQSGSVVVTLGALSNTVRVCVAMKRRALTSTELCADTVVIGPDIAPPPPSVVTIDSAT